MRAALGKKLSENGLPLIGVLPKDPLISSVRMDEIQAALQASIIAGSKVRQDLTVDKVRSPSALIVLAYHPAFLKVLACCCNPTLLFFECIVPS